MSAVQSTPADINLASTSGATPNFGSAIVAGRTITVGIVVHVQTVTSVTDTLGNTYTQVSTVASASPDNYYIYRAFNVSGGTNAVTVNVSAAADFTFAATEVDNVPTTNPNDASNSATGNSTTPSVSVTTVDSAPQMFGIFAHDGTNRTLTSGSGYTMLAENEGGSADMPLHWMYQLFGSSGAKTVDGVIGTGAQVWGIVGASFITAAAAGGAVPGPRRSGRPFPYRPGSPRSRSRLWWIAFSLVADLVLT